jgi:cyclomaltodextrinase / maltogenic alpha-amylase / neopullulanase
MFASFLTRHEAYFPETFSRPSFLDNHDMNRFLWAAGGDIRRLRLAALCQFTLAGSPIIYYGTEVGLSQLRDVRQGVHGLPEESRLPMLWGEAQDTALLDYYQQLIAIRHDMPSYRRGTISLLYADQDILIYSRGKNDDTCMVLNLSLERRKVKIPGVWNKLLLETNSGDIHLKAAHVELAPLGGAILENY